MFFPQSLSVLFCCSSLTTISHFIKFLSSSLSFFPCVLVNRSIFSSLSPSRIGIFFFFTSYTSFYTILAIFIDSFFLSISISLSLVFFLSFLLFFHTTPLKLQFFAISCVYYQAFFFKKRSCIYYQLFFNSDTIFCYLLITSHTKFFSRNFFQPKVIEMRCSLSQSFFLQLKARV